MVKKTKKVNNPGPRPVRPHSMTADPLPVTPLFKRVTLEEIMAQAEIFWRMGGLLTQFPSKESYFAYIKDFYEYKISKMSDQEYTDYAQAQQKDVIKRLEGIAHYVENRIKLKKPS